MKTGPRDFASKPLFVLEMANNHMGDIEHGVRILKEFHAVTKDFDFDFSFKLQHRDDSFFHPDFKDRMDIKHVKRFTETKLGKEQFKRLRDEMTALGYISMNTPWDEKSVDLMEELGFDIIKSPAAPSSTGRSWRGSSSPPFPSWLPPRAWRWRTSTRSSPSSSIAGRISP